MKEIHLTEKEKKKFISLLRTNKTWLKYEDFGKCFLPLLRSRSCSRCILKLDKTVTKNTCAEKCLNFLDSLDKDDLNEILMEVLM